MIHQTDQLLKCDHCGDECRDDSIRLAERHFCCEGCKNVFGILNRIDLCEYYTLNARPGLSQKQRNKDKFKVLADKKVEDKLIQFRDQEQSTVTFYLPQMHCSSCVWLLENLHKVDPGIISSRVNFIRKELAITFSSKMTTLQKVAECCANVGYEPHISLSDLKDKKASATDRSGLVRIGVAGFCFSNIMMMSFPEYFASGEMQEKELGVLFSFINLALALPVFFYSASGFFVSSWKGLAKGFVNIDVPIAFAILITFARSVYEILSHSGAGYLDSMSGIVFFMLLGRFFQDRTFTRLTFDRDYTSYFPLGTTVLNADGTEKQVPISDLKVGHRIKVHRGEIIPADSILFFGKASIDYSFVTGESDPVPKGIGEIVYAGGKQCGSSLVLEIVKDVSQSYLSRLWNNRSFKEEEYKREKVSFVHALSRYFTLVLFSLASASALYWYFNDPAKIWSAVTAILIVACPCALLLSSTFTHGAVLLALQKAGFYVKNANVLERIGSVTTIVFDKTGTITRQGKGGVEYKGEILALEEWQALRALFSQSSHPLSRTIAASIPFAKKLVVEDYKEFSGSGITGTVEGVRLMAGSEAHVKRSGPGEPEGTAVHISIGGSYKGMFRMRTQYREGLKEVVQKLKKRFRLAILSGDNHAGSDHLERILGKEIQMNFQCDPQAKLDAILEMQRRGEQVIMIGDGLNDAGALRQSQVGIAVSEDVNNFSPSCDVIMDAHAFPRLPELLEFAGRSRNIIVGSFILSILYNIVGLYFAFFAELEPVIAAILMPLSSVSIILFTAGMSYLYAGKLKTIQHEKDRTGG